MSVFDYTQAMEGGVEDDLDRPGPLWRYLDALGLADGESPEEDGPERYGNETGDFL